MVRLKLSYCAAKSAEAVLSVKTFDSSEYRSAVAHVSPVDRHTCEPKAGRIYTVSTVAESPSYGGTRTVAACGTFAKAEEIILGNYGDLFETTYLFAVIEEVELDLLYGGFEHRQWWYSWLGDYQTGVYRPIKTPAEYEYVSGFGVG